MGVWCVFLLVICPLTALSLEDNVLIPRSAPCTDLTLVGQQPASGCYWCFQDKCRCMGDMADCSGNNGLLTFIPRLPGDIRRVNFSHNGLTAIEEGEFFHNVTNISLLDLSGNQLVNLSQDAFRLLTNLTHLSLIDNNNLTGGFLLPRNDSDLWRGMALSSLCDVTTLVELDIVTSFLRYNTYYNGYLSHSMPFRDSGLDPLECLGRFSGLRRLHVAVVVNRQFNIFSCPLLGPLKVEHLKISAVTYDGGPTTMLMVSIPNLKIHLKTIKLRNIRAYFCGRNHVLYPNLSYLSMLSSNDSRLALTLCPFSKQQTQVTRKPDGTVYTNDQFDSSQFPELSELHLEDLGQRKFTTYTDWHQALNIWDIFRDNPKLQTLSLDNVKFIDTNRGRNASRVFGGCPSLRNLTLAGNDLGYLDDDVFVELFANLTNLRYVDLAGCHIDNKTLDRTVFAFQHVETLSMAGNNVTSIPDGLVDNMTNLTHLDLHGNQISLVSETTFSAHTRGRLRSLDLSANPFLCSCRLLWFRDWLKSHPALFARSHSDYTCSNLPNTFLVDYDPQNQSCVTPYVIPRYLIVIIIVTVVVSTVTTVIVAYRYRCFCVEHMQRAFYRIRRTLHRQGRYMNQLRHHDLQLREQRVQGRNFRYDIFVCYAAEDMNWVRAHLIPEMEGIYMSY